MTKYNVEVLGTRKKGVYYRDNWKVDTEKSEKLPSPKSKISKISYPTVKKESKTKASKKELDKLKKLLKNILIRQWK